MPAQEMEQLAPLRVAENTILAAPVHSLSEILIHDERDRHLQLAEQLVRQAFDPCPVRRPVALFFREDLTYSASSLRGRPKPRLVASLPVSACCGPSTIAIVALLGVVIAGRTSSWTAFGGWIWLGARIIYLPLYGFGVPGVRTAVWTIGLVGLLMVLGPLLFG